MSDTPTRSFDDHRLLTHLKFQNIDEMSDMLTVIMGSLEQLRGQTLDARGTRQLDRADQAVVRTLWLNARSGH